MSEKESSAPAEQAPVGTKEASSAPAGPAPAAEADSKDAVPAAETAKAEAETDGAAPTTNGNGNSTGNGDAPAASAPSSKGATRTSSRTKQESSSKPAPVKATGKPAKPRPSGATAGGGSKKAASGSAAKEDKNFTVGDIVLARLKGYPAWPARIADPDNIPRQVAAQRPGKNPLTFCVQFFPVGDYAWLNIRELSSLSDTDIKAYLAQPHRKATGGLREAYQTAQDPTEWDEGQADIAAKREAAEGEEEVDELEDEDEAGAPAAGGKRKKAAGGKESTSKKAKTTKNKDDSAPKSKGKAAAKPKAAAKSKSAPDSKPAAENQAAADEDPLSTDPECVKVKEWRHRLQRAFLGKSLPADDEMATYDSLFKSIEEYKGMTIEALQYSKIGKVMKKIAAMASSIPKNEEYKITDRAQKLMNDWQEFIEKNSSGEKKETNGGMEVDA